MEHDVKIPTLYPPWLLPFPMETRRFCRLCGAPVLVVQMPGSSTLFDFEPHPFGRHVFNGARFRLHTAGCSGPSLPDREFYARKELEAAKARMTDFSRTIAIVFVSMLVVFVPTVLAGLGSKLSRWPAFASIVFLAILLVTGSCWAFISAWVIHRRLP